MNKREELARQLCEWECGERYSCDSAGSCEHWSRWNVIGRVDDLLDILMEPGTPALMEGVKVMSAKMPDGKPATSAVIYGQPKPVFQAILTAIKAGK